MKQILQNIKKSNEAECPNCKAVGFTHIELDYGKGIKKQGSVVTLKIGCSKCQHEWLTDYKYFRKKDMTGKVIEPEWAVR